MQACPRSAATAYAAAWRRLTTTTTNSPAPPPPPPPPSLETSLATISQPPPPLPPQINSFRSVFLPISTPGHPAAHLQRRRYQLRWDWHLRNFLVSLLPAAGLAAFAITYEWAHADEVAAARSARVEEQRRREDAFDASVVKSTAGVVEQVHALQGELQAVREEVARLLERQREREKVGDRERERKSAGSGKGEVSGDS